MEIDNSNIVPFRSILPECWRTSTYKDIEEYLIIHVFI